jgi:hypothetical protein
MIKLILKNTQSISTRPKAFYYKREKKGSAKRRKNTSLIFTIAMKRIEFI